jgi:phytoene dehydrogenase-like protein
VDAVVVGAGPNGLAAAIELARAGRSVVVYERADQVGGGARTAELTLPGFHHDVCSAIHPLAAGSPALRGLGVEFLHGEIEAAHPLDGAQAVALHRSVRETAIGLGADGPAYTALVESFAHRWAALAPVLLAPVAGLEAWPRLGVAARSEAVRSGALGWSGALGRFEALGRFGTLGRFGALGVLPAERLARRRFSGERARALFAGMAAHAVQPLSGWGTAAFGLVLLVLGHAVGWPVVRGGSGAIAVALRAELESLGGVVETGRDVVSLRQLPAEARAVLLDVTPRQLLMMCAPEDLPFDYRAALARYRYGPGVFKLDYALSGPVPWLAPECRRAATVHLGGTLAEIAAGEALVARGGHPDRPYVLVAQQSLLDPSRAPAGQHTLWAYCHVRNGSVLDMTDAIERQIDRFAPGWRDLVLARAARDCAAVEAANPNCVGGDINGGAATLRQVIARPVARRVPYATPNPRLFLCSSSTPPGGGVHGMCGYHAARAALRGVLR